MVKSCSLEDLPFGIEDQAKNTEDTKGQDKFARKQELLEGIQKQNKKKTFVEHAENKTKNTEDPKRQDKYARKQELLEGRQKDSMYDKKEDAESEGGDRRALRHHPAV